MNLYWKVQKREYNYFVSFVFSEYKNLKNDYNRIDSIRELYDEYSTDYLYLCVMTMYDDFNLTFTYMEYNSDSLIYFRNNDFVYKGDFNGRKKKLEKLNNISNKL